MHNPVPYLILLAVVLLALHAKGYIKLPARPVVRHPEPVNTMQTPSSRADITAGEDLIDRLARLHGSHILGLAFAKAKKTEVEIDLAGKVARDAADAMGKFYSAPFSDPAPADAAPNPASAAGS